MQTRLTAGVLLSCVLTLFGEVSAQKISDDVIPGDVIFEVPINLTRLSSSLTKVAVTCMVGVTIDPNKGITSSGSDVLSNRVEFPVSAGQVVTTARVVIAAPATPLYKPGTVLAYECALSGLSSDPMAGGWQPLGGKVPVASLQVSPVPVPIRGTFTW
jgi:hypothetical protein